MNERSGLPEVEQLLHPRTLSQILAVILASASLVLVLNFVGVLGNGGDDEATSTTAVVAQLPPTPSTDAPSSDAPASAATGSSGSSGSTGSSGSSPETTAESVTPPGTDGTRPDISVTNRRPASVPRVAQVFASDARADSTDSCGAPTNYQPVNAVDSIRETAWMVSGDGVGAVFTIVFEEPSIVSEVGLVPGYDKFDPCSGTDRFDALRRVTAVRWTFDDGTSIDQEVSPTRDWQSTSVDPPAVASRVAMTILSTTEPGAGRLDHTPVSEIVVS